MVEDFGELRRHSPITPRLKVHHRLPYRPKLVRATTGKVTWKMAPYDASGEGLAGWHARNSYRARIECNEGRHREVADPDAYPRLPPG